MRHSRFYIFILLAACVCACQVETYRQGEVLYEYHCGNCHMPDGSGLAKLIPGIDGPTLAGYEPDSLICLIKYGLRRDSLTNQQMPGNAALSETELANLINYLGHKYLDKDQWVNPTAVRSLYDACQSPH
jgi:mono/diheme cytochrome c family protein